MMALFLAGPAAAQAPGTVFVGGFGQYTYFDSKWNLDTGLGNTWGWGLRVGTFIAPGWSLEGDGTYTPAASRSGTGFLGSTKNGLGGRVKASSFTARLLYTIPSATARSFHVGGGGLIENFRGDIDPNAKTYGYGLNGLVGMNFALSNLTLRVDGFANYLPSNGIKFDFGAQAGIQFTPDFPYLFGANPANAPVGPDVVWWDDLAAPLPGTVEIGGSLQASRFDDNGGKAGPSPKNSNVGFSARAGVFLTDPVWEIEMDGYYSPQNARIRTPGFTATNRPTEVNASAFAARLNYNVSIDTTEGIGRQSSFVFGLGAVRQNYKFVGGTGVGSINDRYTYNLGVSGLAGVRIGLANRIAARIDGVADWMPRHKPSANINAHLRGGLSVMLGGGHSAVPIPSAVPTPAPPPAMVSSPPGA
jgi:hypothetical protein